MDSQILVICNGKSSTVSTSNIIFQKFNQRDFIEDEGHLQNLSKFSSKIIKDNDLKQKIMNGIAHLKSDISGNNREIVEFLFKNKFIKVLCVTLEDALNYDFRASVVIFKGTIFWRSKLIGFLEYEASKMKDMVLRKKTFSPQKKFQLQIMTEKKQVKFYQKEFLNFTEKKQNCQERDTSIILNSQELSIIEEELEHQSMLDAVSDIGSDLNLGFDQDAIGEEIENQLLLDAISDVDDYLLSTDYNEKSVNFCEKPSKDEKRSINSDFPNIEINHFEIESILEEISLIDNYDTNDKNKLEIGKENNPLQNSNEKKMNNFENNYNTYEFQKPKKATIDKNGFQNEFSNKQKDNHQKCKKLEKSKLRRTSDVNALNFIKEDPSFNIFDYVKVANKQEMVVKFQKNPVFAQKKSSLLSKIQSFL